MGRGICLPLIILNYGGVELIKIDHNSIIVFQGDSIRDCNRNRQDSKELGKGYPFLIAAEISSNYPEKNLTFFNRGIGGNTIVDLKERWEGDCLDLKPSMVSILVGINDCYMSYCSEKPISQEDFEASYRDILTKTRENTKAGIVICEPFVLPVKEEHKKMFIKIIRYASILLAICTMATMFSGFKYEQDNNKPDKSKKGDIRMEKFKKVGLYVWRLSFPLGGEV